MGLRDLFSRSPNADEVTYEELTRALASGEIALIDVREPQEFANEHVPGAINQPLSRFDPDNLPRSLPVVLMCKAGGRSAQALARARAAGRADIRHYPGGANGWANRGGPMV